MAKKISFIWGKYKGEEIKDCEDIEYLRWLLKKTNEKNWQYKFIKFRISQLEHLAQ